MLETVEVKRAMFNAANKRILLAGSKFQRQALHAMTPLQSFDAVIVDDDIAPGDLQRMRDKDIHVVVAPIADHRTHRAAGRRSDG